MSRGVTHRSGDVGWNGKMLYKINFGRIIPSNGTQYFGFVASCDGTIVSFPVTITTQLTNAAAALQLGTEASKTSLLANLDIHSYTAASYNLIANLAATSLTAGVAYVFSVIDGDTTGLLTASLVVEPR